MLTPLRCLVVKCLDHTRLAILLVDDNSPHNPCSVIWPERRDSGGSGGAGGLRGFVLMHRTRRQHFNLLKVHSRRVFESVCDIPEALRQRFRLEMDSGSDGSRGGSGGGSAGGDAVSGSGSTSSVVNGAKAKRAAEEDGSSSVPRARVTSSPAAASPVPSPERLHSIPHKKARCLPDESLDA